MRYLALATDYDGTIAHHGRVDENTLAALERLLASGRKLILVTGRELDDLKKTFAHLHLFEWVVAENGALLYQPGTHETVLLGPPPPEAFVQALKERGVGPISVGGVIVATWHPHETVVLKTIRDLGLELQVIFNKGAVMVLPASINKATGLTAVLQRMGLSPHNVVGIGDAENDHAFLRLCECGVAVSNALTPVKEQADLVTRGDHGAGVAELIDALLRDDLQEVAARQTRRHLLLGTRADGSEDRVSPLGTSLLVAGPSGSGKSTVATGLLERLCEAQYQVCVIDPEGDYGAFEAAMTLGSGDRPPTADEVIQLLQNPGQSVVVNLIGLSVTDRPGFFLSLLPRLVELRAGSGRPHWLLVDEAHHLLPASWVPALAALPGQLEQLGLITVHPDQVSPAVLQAVNTVVAVGPSPESTLQEFAAAVGEQAPAVTTPPEPGQVTVWRRGEPAPYLLQPAPSVTERRRHIRKYAEGELPPDRSFYFRGPDDRLNLRAQNLILFLQLADGVDEETWRHHLHQGDYSRWFEAAIKDRELAAEAEEIERQSGLSAEESRRLIRSAVERRYTLPSTGVLPMPGTDAAPRWS